MTEFTDKEIQELSDFELKLERLKQLKAKQEADAKAKVEAEAQARLEVERKQTHDQLFQVLDELFALEYQTIPNYIQGLIACLNDYNMQFDAIITRESELLTQVSNLRKKHEALFGITEAQNQMAQKINSVDRKTEPVAEDIVFFYSLPKFANSAGIFSGLFRCLGIGKWFRAFELR